MKKKELCVKTKRMMIQPMFDEEIEIMIEAFLAKKERKKLLEQRGDRKQK